MYFLFWHLYSIEFWLSYQQAEEIKINSVFFGAIRLGFKENLVFLWRKCFRVREAKLKFLHNFYPIFGPFMK